MHELALAKDLFGILSAEADKKGLKRISMIKIALGEASGIDPEFLRHSFVDHLFPGSPAEDARLEISVLRAGAKCARCGASVEELVPGGECPSCRGGDIRIEGMDVYIEEIEGV